VSLPAMMGLMIKEVREDFRSHLLKRLARSVRVLQCPG
jgi:hypothetical protein